MTIDERIMEDLKAAMRAKDELVRDTLRMVRSDLNAKSIEIGHDLSEEEALAVLQRAVKTRQDSLVEYEKGGRSDLADKERLEIETIRRYLPEMMDEGQAREAIGALIAELGASSKKDMGRVMKEVRARYGSRIDGKLASSLVGAALA